MRLILRLFLLLLAWGAFGPPRTALAQQGKLGAGTITTAGTTVNTYTSLTADAASGTSTLTVANSALTGGAFGATGLATGDLLMLIQMQGATITTTTTTSAYGAVTAYNNAGRYELVEVKTVPSATAITLQCNLTNSYTAAGKVQVVRVPRYTTLTLNTNTSIVAPAWNGTTGGIVALDVQGVTTFNTNAKIDVTGLGFRGGALSNTSVFPNSSAAYALTDNTKGAEKGESIAGSQATYDGLTGRYGRGAAANGGGGGNAHNAGGGGGSNAGTGTWTGTGNPNRGTGNIYDNAWNQEAANFATSTSPGGGRGGYSFSTNDANATTQGPGNTAWGGDNRLNQGGLGGRPLDATSRLFFGGGGGAGDENNGVGTAGGNGGGLIYILTGGNLANATAATGTSLTASGSASANAGASDAAGGGGGGGTIVLNLTGSGSSISVSTVSVPGGNGGNMTSTTNEADGPGASGGGGYILSTVTVPTSSLVAGTSGTTTSTSLLEFPPNGATNGAVGLLTVAAQTGQCAVVADVTTNVTGATALTTGQPSGNYTATFTNDGPDVAAAVQQQLTLPAGVTNVVLPTGATLTGNTIDFGNAGTLASGATNSFVFSFTTPGTPGTLALISNTTTTTSQGLDTAPNSKTLSVTVTASTPPANCAKSYYDNTTAYSGLSADYYSGFYNNDLTYFNNNTPKLKRVDGSINFTTNTSFGDLTTSGVSTATNPVNQNFSARYRGSFTITTAGSYTFSSDIDDNLQIWIDGNAIPTTGAPQTTAFTPTLVNAIINVPTYSNGQASSAAIPLSAGPHNILIFYGAGGGPNNITLKYSGPDTGNTTKLIPNSVLCAGPSNVPPTAIAVMTSPIPTTNGPTTIKSLNGSDFETTGSVTNYAIATLPANGTLRLSDGTAIAANQMITAAQAATLTYQPNAGFVGTDTFTFSAIDNTGQYSNTTATYTIPVVPSVSGYVYEDANYGGGVGRSRPTLGTGAVGRAGARVELYDNTGTFVTSTLTDANGFYSLPASASTAYTVRVVNNTVISARTGATFTGTATTGYTSDQLAVQTYNGTTDRVGGEAPTKVDAAAGTTGTTLASLNTTTTIAESQFAVNTSTATTTGADFGYNFDVVTNTNDAGQGSLRQFITNANALGGEASLAQSGSNGAGTLPTGKETSIFMIPSGSAVAGQRAGLTSGLTSGVAVITPATALPAISGPNTSIDGTTQTFNIGNTNNVVLGAGGTVGTGATALSQVNGPEVQLVGSTAISTGLNVATTGTSTSVIGLSVYGFGNTNNGNAGDNDLTANILSSADNFSLSKSVVGSTATSFTNPAIPNTATNVRIASGANVVITNNLIGFSGLSGIRVASAGATVTNNEIRSSAQRNTGYDGLQIRGSSLTATGNLFVNNSAQGIDAFNSTGSNVVTGNTFTGNGIGTTTGAPVETAAIRVIGTGNTISQNVINANYGAGVEVLNGATGVISQNSIYSNGTIASANGTAASGEIGIDLLNSTDNASTGTAPYVTINRAGGTGTGGNNLLNFPVITSSTIVGTNLVVTGYARPGSVVELFGTGPTTDPSGFGQGRTYLGTFTEGSGADTNSGTGTYGPGTVNGLNQGTDNTNLFTFTIPLTGSFATVAAGTVLTSTATLSGVTSEFSGNVAVNTAPLPQDVTNATVTNTSGPVVLNPNLKATASGTANGVANTIVSYTVSPASTGTLYYNNVAVTAATVVPAANLGLLTYQPMLGSTTAATFTYTATDANGTTSVAHLDAAGTTTTTGPATYTIPVSAVADLTTTIAGPTTLNPGQPSGTYTATFTNEGPNPGTAVTQKVTLPAGATNVVLPTGATLSGSTIDFGTATTLASGASNAFSFSFTPAATATGNLAITSNIGTTGTTSQGANTAPDFSTLTAMVTPVADVATTLTANTSPVAAGTPATATTPAKFTVTFSNNGPATANGITGTVQLPTGLTNVTISGTNGVSGSYNPATGVVTYSGITSAPSTSVITFDAPASGPVVATANISTTTNEAGRTANNTASASIPISPTFDLATTLSGPTSAVPGDLVTLAVTTTNNGPSASPNAVQTVLLPQGLTNVYVSNGGVYNGASTAQNITVNGVTYSNVQPGQVVFPTLTSLPSGQTVANSVSFSQPSAAYSPSALVSTSTAGETNTANNTAYLNGATSSTSLTVRTPAAGTANVYTTITSSVPSTTIGGSVTLTVVTGNNGPNQATGVTQTVQLLPGLTGLTISNGGTYSSTTGIVTFPTLADGANGSASATSVTNTITFAAPASTGNNGQLLAMAAVSTTNTDPVPADNVASVGVTLIQSSDLATTITGPASAQAGQPVTYTASFLNNGPMTAANVIETVQLPAGLGTNGVTVTDATGATVTGASYNSTTGLLTLPALATASNGAAQVYNLVFVAPSQNLAVRSSVTSATTDAALANNSATATTTVSASADLATTVAGPVTAVVGSAVTYSVTTTNNGPSTATNAVTTLQLATGFTTATIKVGGQTGTLNGTTISFTNGAVYNTSTGLVTFPNVATQAPGVTTTNYVTFVMPNATGGQTAGVASASSDITDPTSGNNTASVATSVAPTTTTSADITAAVTATATSAVPGATIAFTATYGNNGTDPAVNVLPTLQLAPGLTAATLTVAGQTGTLNNGLITFSSSGAVYNTQTGLVTFPVIASQASGTANNVSYAVNVTAPGNGPVTVVAATTSNTSEPNTAAAQANDVASTSVTITPTFDEVTSLSGPVSAPAGSSQTYTVTTTNNGPSLTTGTTTQTVTLPAGITATNISNGGMQSGTTITWTVPAGQAAGANGAVANSFTITQPTGGATLAANVTSPGESNTTNNTAYLNGATVATATTITNLAPLAYAVVNTLQGPQSNEAGGLTNGLLISPLAASDPENSFATQKYTVVAAPDASQGTLYYNSTGTTYVAVASGQTLTNAQAQTLKFKAATGYTGNASFTYLTTDAVGNVSPSVNYTIPIESDIDAPAYTVLPAKTAAYTAGDVIAYTTDANGAVYNAATALVYKADGTLQTGASNGVASAVAGAFTSSRGDVTSLAALGITVDSNGRLVVTSPGTVASPNLRAGNYTVSVTTTDANGGITMQLVSFTIRANPLPVALTAFTAQAVQNRDALLNWATASEQNSASFEVERSLNGTTFTKVGQLAAQGTTTTAHIYTFTDAGIGATAQGTVYYRLRQLDLNGAVSYSPTRTVSFTKAAAVALSIYPNPATTSTVLDLSTLPAAGSYQVVVLDATGRQVLTATLAGGLSLPLDLTSLASGTYNVLVTGKLADGTALRQALRLIKE